MLLALLGKLKLSVGLSTTQLRFRGRGGTAPPFLKSALERDYHATEIGSGAMIDIPFL
jgi:hypothetical protein